MIFRWKYHKKTIVSGRKFCSMCHRDEQLSGYSFNVDTDENDVSRKHDYSVFICKDCWDRNKKSLNQVKY